MATIGLAYVLEGVGDLMWGANVKELNIGFPEGPSEIILDTTDMFIEKLEISAAVVAVLLVVSLTLFSQYTKMGRALRAVADDHQAALSVGISFETIWWIVWSVSGLVALVAGVMWGAKSGVQFSLVFNCIESSSRLNAWWFYFNPWSNCRWPNYWCW